MNPERATGKRPAPDCIHLKKRADLMQQGNIPKLCPNRSQSLPPPQLTGWRKRNGVGEGVEAWDC